MPIYSRLSIEQAIAAARAFAAAERGLVLPVMLAFQLLPGLLVDILWPADIAPSLKAFQEGRLAGGQLALLLAPDMIVLLANVLGGLVLTSLAVMPRQTVGDAIRHAARRFPVWLAATLVIAIAMLFGMMLIAALVMPLGKATDPNMVNGLLLGWMLAVAITIGARMIMLVPLVVDRPVGPIEAVKASWRMTQGHALRLLGFILIFLIGGGVVQLALGTALGGTILLIGRLTGAAGLAVSVADVVVLLIGALVYTVLVLIIAQLYRQLAASSRGI